MPRQVKLSKQAEILSKPRGQWPRIFGRGGRDRALMALAVNGPMTVREIGRSISSDSSKAFRMVEQLRECGLVVKRDREGGRKYVALNRNLRAYRRLHPLLVAMNAAWPGIAIEPRPARWYMDEIDDGSMPPERLDLVFQSEPRSRILLLVAAVRTTHMQRIADILQLGGPTVLYAVNALENEGILLTRTQGRTRFVMLNREYPVAAELRALLRAFIAESLEYRAFRRMEIGGRL